MDNTLIFTEGNADDLQQLRQLGITAYSPYLELLEPEGQSKLLAGITNEQTYKDLLRISTVFTVKKGNEIVGMAFYVPAGNPTDIYPADWCYIRFVAVHPKHSGKGIGKQLTKMCIEKAVATEETVIGLHTSEFMDAARHIYENAGFKQLREIPPRFGKRYWLYAMDLT